MFNICYLDDFNYSKSSLNIYSTFYIEVDGYAFPDNQWIDFPLAIMRMWCENLLSNVINIKNSQFKLFFMDGPFVIECLKNKEDIEMLFVNNRDERTIEYKTTINSHMLVSIIYQVANKILWLIDQKHFVIINDAIELKRLLVKVGEQINKHNTALS